MKKLLTYLILLIVAAGCNNLSKEEIIRNKRLEVINLVCSNSKDKGEFYAKAERGIELLHEVIEMNPIDVELDYYEIGSYKAALGAELDAIYYYSLAISANPNYDKPYRGRAFCKYAIKEYNSAIEDCSKALELNPNRISTMELRGLCYHQLGEFEKAIKDFTKFIKSDASGSGYLHRGYTYYHIGEEDKACSDWNSLVYAYQVRMVKDSIKGINEICELDEYAYKLK